MCGALLAVCAVQAANVGSSPHVRGTFRLLLLSYMPGRIIPACAGHFHNSGRLTTRGWDHPRMCGALVGYGYRSFTPAGSSPHVRGTFRTPPFSSIVSGIIPACAGHLLCLLGFLRGLGDHPRMCGALTPPPGATPTS